MNRSEESWREQIARARDQLASDQDKAATSAESDQTALPGENPPQIFPGFQVVRELHRGGQGIVYLAIESETERKVAIKVLLAGALASASALRRFEREVKLAARLNHPNIITILQSGQTTDQQPFYVMDYVRGAPLDTYVRQEEIDMRQTLALFATICHAVSYAHQKGVIHRDLKPSNILVASDGQPKVLDFGLAKQLAGPEAIAQTATGAPLGTVAFMSPEQVRGNPDEIDTRADVYALGVILYTTMTGTFPYPVHRGLAEVFRHITDTSPRKPSRVWTAAAGVKSAVMNTTSCPLDHEVESMILKSIEKEPDRRYAIAGELGRDIERYLAGEPIEAKGDSLRYKLSKAIRKHRLVAAVFVGYFVLVTGGLIGALWSLNAVSVARQDERDQRRLAEIQQGVLQEKSMAASRVFDRLVSHVEDEFESDEFPNESKRRLGKHLGDAHRSLSQFERAESFYRQSLKLADSHDQIRLKASLAELYLETRQLDAAEEILRELKSDRAKSNLALVFKYQGKFPESEAIYRELLAQFRTEENRISEATVLHNLGGLEYERENYNQAIDYIERCLKIREELWSSAAEPRKASLERSILIAKNNLGGKLYVCWRLAEGRTNTSRSRCARESDPA